MHNAKLTNVELRFIMNNAECESAEGTAQNNRVPRNEVEPCPGNESPSCICAEGTAHRINDIRTCSVPPALISHSHDSPGTTSNFLSCTPVTKMKYLRYLTHIDIG